MVLAAILGPTVQVELDQHCSVVEPHCNENPIYVFPENDLRGRPKKVGIYFWSAGSIIRMGTGRPFWLRDKYIAIFDQRNMY